MKMQKSHMCSGRLADFVPLTFVFSTEKRERVRQEEERRGGGISEAGWLTGVNARSLVTQGVIQRAALAPLGEQS